MDRMKIVEHMMVVRDKKIIDLKNDIRKLSLTTGPKGVKGDRGPTGSVSAVQFSAGCNCELYLIIKLCQSQLAEIFMFIPVPAGYFIYWSDLCSDRPHSKYHSQETGENGEIFQSRIKVRPYFGHFLGGFFCLLDKFT